MSPRLLLMVPVLACLAVAPSASAAVPTMYKNCTNLRQHYPHGIGRDNAHDKTSGKPVTDFTHSTAGYNKAVKANSDLDRDKDGIACEKA